MPCRKCTHLPTSLDHWDQRSTIQEHRLYHIPQTWLETPMTPAASSAPVTCPMCRRNLATLALITRIVWSKEMTDAIPLWMDHMARAVESQVRPASF